MNETINMEKQKAEKLCDERLKENTEKVKLTWNRKPN